MTVSVALVTLGCTRNEVDSEELAARLRAGGFELTDDAAEADTVVVNTCGFIESAKKDSVDALLEAADLKQTGKTRAVVAVGCMAERYGRELADSLPEADAVFGFDDYPTIAAKLTDILAGGHHQAHVPADRRALLPISPVERTVDTETTPGMAGAQFRVRLDDAPWAPLKIASGCDRRCTFCAIPQFRGASVSRTPEDILAEARWLSEQGVRELFLVSENSTAYGKDLGDLDLLPKLLRQLTEVDGVDRVRVSYLQPAQIRPGLLEVIADVPGVVPYFDLSFQHASPSVLRRMKRFGDPDTFLALVGRIRQMRPEAGIRSNVIVGFPGETDEELETLGNFLVAAELDVVGVFGYSDEEGTEAMNLPDKLDDETIEQRASQLRDVVEQLTSDRAAARIGETVSVLVEDEDEDGLTGRAEHQAPEIDGITRLIGFRAVSRGDIVRGRVTGSEGVDLVAEPE